MVLDSLNCEKVILIVDDVELNRAILSELFRKEYGILEAENGLDALDLIEKYGENIKVVLLDLVMPVINGFEVVPSDSHYFDYR